MLLHIKVDISMTYEDLLIEADNNNIIVKEKTLQAHKGRIKGNRIAIKKELVGFAGIIDAYKHRCQNLSESAEYLGITEEFLNDALLYYRNKYGTHVTIDNYGIIFDHNGNIIYVERVHNRGQVY